MTAARQALIAGDKAVPGTRKEEYYGGNRRELSVRGVRLCPQGRNLSRVRQQLRQLVLPGPEFLHRALP